MDANPSSSALQTILRREMKLPASAPQESVTQPETLESEYEAFSFGRVGARPQLMVALRKCDGKVRVRPYALLQGIDTDDEQAQFTLDFSGFRAIIRGRNLETLFRYLWLHRVVEITEADRSVRFLAEEEQCVIESLEFMAGPLTSVAVTGFDEHH